MAQIPHLPDELLTELLSSLPKSGLKSARLTCLRWSRIGAESLFQRVYFAPRKGTMARFEMIAGHPIVSKSINGLVYDARLFQRVMLYSGRYDAKYLENVAAHVQHVYQLAAEASWSEFLTLLGRSNVFYDAEIR